MVEDFAFDAEEAAEYERWLRTGDFPPGIRPPKTAASGRPVAPGHSLIKAMPTAHSSYRAIVGGEILINLCSHAYAGGPIQLTAEMGIDDVPCLCHVRTERACSAAVVDACVPPSVLQVADGCPSFLRQLMQMVAAEAAHSAGLGFGAEVQDITRLSEPSVGAMQELVFEVPEGVTDRPDKSAPEKEQAEPTESVRGPRPVGVLKPEGARGDDGRPDWVAGTVRLPSEHCRGEEVDVSVGGTRLEVLFQGRVIWKCRLAWPVEEGRSNAWLRPREGNVRLRLATRAFTAAEKVEREREDARREEQEDLRVALLRKKLLATRGSKR
eukprot:Hpha_TRINITY_DN28492_c0_g1::TRINITY_DN28492_c0_g1_i1::g.183930::m.183930